MRGHLAGHRPEPLLDPIFYLLAAVVKQAASDAAAGSAEARRWLQEEAPAIALALDRPTRPRGVCAACGAAFVQPPSSTRQYCQVCADQRRRERAQAMRQRAQERHRR